MKAVEENAPHDVRMVLAGNKCDLVKDRQVKEAEIVEFCEKNRMSYIQCSAKKNLNTGEVVEGLLWGEPEKQEVQKLEKK